MFFASARTAGYVRFYIMNIPKKFYHTKDEAYPVIVTTVGELKKVLEDIPDDFPINQGYTGEGGAKVTIYNMNPEFGPAHLQLDEAEDW